jgi:hypothetical protein
MLDEDAVLCDGGDKSHVCESLLDLDCRCKDDGDLVSKKNDESV